MTERNMTTILRRNKKGLVRKLDVPNELVNKYRAKSLYEAKLAVSEAPTSIWDGGCGGRAPTYSLDHYDNKRGWFAHYTVSLDVYRKEGADKGNEK